jgi:tetratricopeptide (TPR) repeat protein
MHKALGLVLLISLICKLVVASDKPSDVNQTVYIYTTDGCAHHAQALLEQVSSNLAADHHYSYQVTQTQAYEFPGIHPDEVYAALTGCSENSEVMISVVAKSLADINRLSPVLFSTYNFNPVGDGRYPVESEWGLEFSANYLTAVALYSANQCSEAKPYFEKTLHVIPKDIAKTGYFMRAQAAIPFYLANCALEEHRYADAISSYQKSLFHNGADMLNLYAVYPAVNLAWTYLQTHDEQKALELADLALWTTKYWASVTPYWVDFHVQLLAVHARIYQLASKLDIGLKDINDAINIVTNPKNHYTPSKQLISSLYLQRGQIYLLQYEWDKALADYNQAVELQPDNAEAYFYRGVLYASVLQTGQALHKNALADFEHYLGLAPEGNHAADARKYIEQLQKEAEALSGGES